MNNVRLIGDIHGDGSPLKEGKDKTVGMHRMDHYIGLTQSSDYSIQVGDMGFNYFMLNEMVDPQRHRIVGGNHDNYDNLSPHFLGNFGSHQLGNFEFFYYRGACSHDWMARTEHVDWWREEEVNWLVSNHAIEHFEKHTPSIVITHDCPIEVLPHVSTMTREMQMRVFGKYLRPSHTQLVLQKMFDIHKPDYWVFGHHHKNLRIKHKGTEFICLGKLSHLDIDNEGNWGNIESHNLPFDFV